MNTQHILQMAGGALLVVFGFVSLFTGWVDHGTALGFITTGLSVFGLTSQNAKLEGALRASGAIK